MIVTVLLLAALAAIAAIGIGLTVRVRRDFAAQNEVVPGVPTKAPASWAGAHTPEARLHRRLRDAVAAAHTAADASGMSLDAVTWRIDQEAAALDDRLVAAAALPLPHRDEAVERLEPLVASLEATVAAFVERLASSAGPAELTGHALDETDLALEALARAREDVERADRAGRPTDGADRPPPDAPTP